MAVLLASGACGDSVGEDPATTVPPVASTSPVTTTAGCADVVAAEATAAGDGTFAFAVTVRSADTGWEKYADAWQVLGPEGAVLGTRDLLHPHVDKQPFTRSLGGVEIPDGVAEVTVRARDSVAGWCGAEVTLAVSR